jgi:hypothetical protein
MGSKYDSSIIEDFSEDGRKGKRKGITEIIIGIFILVAGGIHYFFFNDRYSDEDVSSQVKLLIYPAVGLILLLRGITKYQG